jgi:hypothetical protein
MSVHVGEAKRDWGLDKAGSDPLPLKTSSLWHAEKKATKKQSATKFEHAQ